MGCYTIHLVGESHKNPDGSSRQAEIKRCSAGEWVELVRELDNRFDEDAVFVRSQRGVGIGYIGRDQNHWIARLLDEGKEVRACIQAIIGGERGKPSRGVILAVATAGDDPMELVEWGRSGGPARHAPQFGSLIVAILGLFLSVAAVALKIFWAILKGVTKR